MANLVPLRTAHPNNIVRLRCIDDRIFLTSLYGARTVTGNASIVAVANPYTTDYLKDHPAFYRCFVQAPDSTAMDTKRFHAVFGKAASLIHERISSGTTEPIIIHCHAGRNRSVCALMYYIYMYTDKDVKKILREVREINIRHRSLTSLTNSTFESHILKMANTVWIKRLRHQRQQRQMFGN